MKRLIPIALITILILTLTSCSNKWQKDISDMPEELKQQHEEILEEHLAFLEENESIESSFEVAYRYHQLGDYKKAIEYYEQTLDYNVYYATPLNNLANIYEEVEEYDLAAEYIIRLFEVRQDSEEAINDTVRILLKADDPINAQVALDQFASIMLADPESEAYSYYETMIAGLQADIDEYLE